MWYQKYIGTYKNLIPCFQFLGTKEFAQALREKKQPLVILELVLLQHVNLNYYSAVAVAVVGRRGIRVKERRQP
ncbi:hypothetical protein ACB092_05G266500 [Castanea dentata]